MRATQFWTILCSCLLALATQIGWSQPKQKPGLYEMTSLMTWQKSPMPSGMNMPSGMANPLAAKPNTAQFCLTQEQVDKSDSTLPQTGSHITQGCKMTNTKVVGNTMKGVMACTGRMPGQADVESSWSGDTSKSKVHFTGTMNVGVNNALPVEWTMDTTSIYKGPNCGNVKPIEAPKPKIK